jgi:CheY-like chemotaxis protein
MKKNASKRKILFAEDDDAMRRFIEIILRKDDYEVVSCEDGLKAMTAALGEDFDAIVADAVMPNMTGYDLCRMLRANDRKKKIPFIILSGIEQKDDECIADFYLLKDNNIKENLTKTLDSIFAKK